METWRARYAETHTPGSEGGPGTGGNTSTAPGAYLTTGSPAANAHVATERASRAVPGPPGTVDPMTDTEPAAPRYAGPHVDGDRASAPSVPVLGEPAGGPHWTPAPPFPAPVAPSASIRYPSAADGSSGWAAGPGEPASVPLPIPGTDGPHTRPGWLTQSRDSGPAA